MNEEWHYLVRKDTKEPCVVSSLLGIDLDEYEDILRLDGPLSPFEKVVDGKVVEDTAARIDSEFGANHITEARNRKTLESMLILAGVRIDGLVEKEAALRGMSSEELAKLILSKSEKIEKDELDRMAQKISPDK